jgi:hypothetical protein
MHRKPNGYFARLGFVGVTALLIAAQGRAATLQEKARTQIAALALPSFARADRQQWASFLTNVAKRLGEEFRPDQREQLAEVFPEARYQLVDAVSSGASDPVPQLFSDAWIRLLPLVNRISPALHSRPPANTPASSVPWTLRAP